MQLDKSKIYADVISIIDSLDGHEFEYFCAKLLENCEFRDVKVTQGSGDYGIDIIARYHNMIYGIQCKRYASKVGVKAVQEALSGAEYYHCDVAVVLSNGTFTPNAIEMSKKTGVRLWDRNSLLNLIGKCENLDFVKLFEKNNSTEEKKSVPNKENKVSKGNKKSTQNTKNNSRSQNGSVFIALILCLFLYAIVKAFDSDDAEKIFTGDSNTTNTLEDDITQNASSYPEEFTWSSLYEEDHPCFANDLVSSNSWINKYSEKIAIDNDKIDKNTVMYLNSGSGKYEGKIVGITIYYGKIKDCKLEDILYIFKEYIPLEELQKYYELEDAFTLSDIQSPENTLYYFSEWKIKDEYYNLYDSGDYNGTYQITLSISLQDNAMGISNDGIPNWAFPGNIERSGYTKTLWKIQNLL